MEEKRLFRLIVYFAGLVFFRNATQGEEFLVASVLDGYTAYILCYSSDTEAWVQIHPSPRRILKPYQQSFYQFSPGSRVTSGIENKSVTVNSSDDTVFCFLVNGYTRTSILPIPGLGTKYIVSSCLPPGNFTSVFVIAAHSHKTDVSITFRLQGNVTYDNRTYSDGDTLNLSLEEYQTFTIRSAYDLTGTVVNTTQTVALFSGVTYNNVNNNPASYEQLLPVQLYGQEYIVAVPDPAFLHPSTPAAVYQLQIISEQIDTQIVFNNGSTFSVDENRLFRQYLTPNTNIQFSSNTPVMTILCRVDSSIPYNTWYYNEFVVIPSLTLYTKHAVFHAYGTLKVLTESAAVDIVVQNKSVANIPGQWRDIPGTSYKVGTWTEMNGILSVTSNSSFTLSVMSPNHMYNGGYAISNSQSDSGFLSHFRDT